MSRRITFVLLAATAALIATQAVADPECFGDTCHLPEGLEPPAVSMPPPEDVAAPEARAAARETTTAMAKPAPALPQVAAAPQDEPQPLARRPLPRVVVPVQTVAEPATETVAEVPSAPRSARLAPRPRPRKESPALVPAPVPEISAPPADYARTVRVSSPDPNYVVGYNSPVVGGIVVVAPQVIYGAGRAPVYMLAPSAKIITIDSDD